MKKILLGLIICILSFGSMGISFAETGESQEELVKNIILKKSEIEENIPKGKEYVKVLDSFFEKYGNNSEKIRVLSNRTWDIKKNLGDTPKEKQILLIIEYIHLKIMYQGFSFLSPDELELFNFLMSIDSEETRSKDNDINLNDDTVSVVIDMNHPLAGKVLIFDVEIIKITKGPDSVKENIVESGDNIEVHYTGTLENGEQFDSSRNRGQTLPFTAGVGQMITGFDAGVIGMKLQESKILELSPNEAYGERDPNRTEIISAKDLQSFVDAGYKLEVGEKLPTQFGEFEIIKVIR